MRPQSGAPRPRSTDEDQKSSIQAVVLIAVAVIIGVLLLWKGFDQEGGLVEAKDTTSTTTTVPETATKPPPIETTTTTTPPVTVAPAQVSVVVANASGGSGLAGKAATELKAEGYSQTRTTDAATQAKSAVYYASDAKDEAAAVAKVLGIDTSLVAPMPATPPVTLNGATVAVILGADQL